VRHLLEIGYLALAAAPVSLAMRASATISTAGATLSIPSGWHAAVARTPSCDPERLIVMSSAPLRVSASGQVAAPRSGQVVLLLLEDRYVQDRPSGDLRRPAHFRIAWNSLVRIKPSGGPCGNPNAPAYMHYFKTHGRYLGFIVYPSKKIGPRTRAKTLAVMDSLRVSA
jgi:hypothetical protein